jgi:hypothetical protein
MKHIEQSPLPPILTLRKDSLNIFFSRTIVRFFSTEPWGGMERPSEPLVQEFLKDDQKEFIFPTKKKKKWGRKRTAISRTEGPAFETER